MSRSRTNEGFRGKKKQQQEGGGYSKRTFVSAVLPAHPSHVTSTIPTSTSQPASQPANQPTRLKIQQREREEEKKRRKMLTLNLAYTSRINPPCTTPLLTRAQIWAGLQRKIRFAQDFVPVIESCAVLEDNAETGTVTRDVVFKKGLGPKDTAREVVRGFWPSVVCQILYIYISMLVDFLFVCWLVGLCVCIDFWVVVVVVVVLGTVLFRKQKGTDVHTCTHREREKDKYTNANRYPKKGRFPTRRRHTRSQHHFRRPVWRPRRSTHDICI